MSSKMDPRCPKKLENTPTAWCDLAVLRLKAIRNAGKELSEEEEALLPGCPWAIDSQMSHYCFFEFLAKYTSDKTLSDIEIASLLNVSLDTVKKTEKTGLAKIRETREFSDLRSSHSGAIVSETVSEEDYKIYR